MAKLVVTMPGKGKKNETKLKKFFTGITVIFISVLFTLLLIELVLRLVYDFRAHERRKGFHAITRLYRVAENKELVYELCPNSQLTLEDEGIDIKINCFGFRDNYYSLNKGDKKRIIFIGDSLTYGWSVNLHETYHKQLEELLKSKNYDVEVMGMGVVGYNTVQEYYLIKEKVLKFNPDIIVLQICPNDFRKTLGIKKIDKGKYYKLVTHRDVVIPYVLGKNNISHFFMRHSHLFKFINVRLELLLKKINKDYSVAEYFLMGEEKSFHYLKKIYNLLDGEGIQFCAVIFPFRKTRKIYRFASLHKRIGDLLTYMNVPYIDLYQKFNITGPEDIWADKSHPNNKGNQIAAQALLDFLVPMIRQ
jgi:lysophospholipase L1-like esterase